MFESSSRVTLLCKSDYEKIARLGFSAVRKTQSAGDNLARLETAKIVDDHLYPKDAAKIGTVVSLKDLGTGSIARLLLTDGRTKDRNQPQKLLPVSVTSPLGATLLGMREGENIKWTLPNGHRRYLRISEVARSGCTGIAFLGESEQR